MAKQPTPPTVDPQATYAVQLARSIRVGRTMVHPGPRVRLRGDVVAAVLADNADAIVAYEPA